MLANMTHMQRYNIKLRCFECLHFEKAESWTVLIPASSLIKVRSGKSWNIGSLVVFLCVCYCRSAHRIQRRKRAVRDLQTGLFAWHNAPGWSLCLGNANKNFSLVTNTLNVLIYNTLLLEHHAKPLNTEWTNVQHYWGQITGGKTTAYFWARDIGKPRRSRMMCQCN